MRDKIEQVKQKRKNDFLPKIESRIKTLTDLSAAVGQLDELLRLVKIQAEQKHGEYYQMTLKDPTLEIKLEQLSTAGVLDGIARNLEELERLRSRFSRGSISLQIFGMAGSGKSTYIQSVTGLPNEVVLAADGNHCTGASSFIYNSDHFEAKIYFYTSTEILHIFNENLKAIQRECNLPERQLSDFGQIRDFKFGDYGLPEGINMKECLLKYVRNFDLIRNLIAGNDRNGAPLPNRHTDPTGRNYIVIYDKAEVQQWVAQHNGKDPSTPDYRTYTNYLAVNHVDIYNPFVYADAGDIVLMDTVGLGDSTSDIATKSQLYQAIADNSDAVVMLYKPEGTWRTAFDGVSNHLFSLRYVNPMLRGEERLSLNELYFVINKKTTDDDAFKKMLGQIMKRYKELGHDENVLVTKAIDKADVEENALVPILKQLINNLAKIDSRKVEKVNKLGADLYILVKDLADKVSTIVSESMKGSFHNGGLFDTLYNDAVMLSRPLAKLNNEYKGSDLKSTEIENEVRGVIRNIRNHRPPVAKVVDRLEGGGAQHHVDNVYNYFADNMRAGVRDEFESLNQSVITRLQDEVKAKVINVIKNEGLLGNLYLETESGETIDADADPMTWFKTLIDTKLGDYELLETAFNDILNYRLNIEGLLEYKVNIALDYLDQTSEKFVSLPGGLAQKSSQEQAEMIVETLGSSIGDIANDLMEGIQELLKIPARSFYSRIRKLRERIFFLEDGTRCLRNFYRDNCQEIWNDKFKEIATQQVATGKWKEIADSLSAFRNKNKFTTSLDNK